MTLKSFFKTFHTTMSKTAAPTKWSCKRIQNKGNWHGPTITNINWSS